MKQFFEKKRVLPVWVSLIVILFSSGAVWLLLGFLNQWSDTLFYFAKCYHHFTLLLLNWSPVFLTMLLLFFLTRHGIFSALFGGMPFIIMGLVNMVKTELRQEAFIPSDFKLIREAFAVIGGYGAGNIILFISAIILAALLMVLALLKWRRTRLHLAVRIGGAFLCLITAALAYKTVYSDGDLYDSYLYSQGGKSTEYACKGFVYSFIHDISNMSVSSPDDYVASEYTGTESADESENNNEATVQPHVIMIMSEAYSGVSESEAFDFTDYTDPMQYYKLAAENALISGQLAVDVNGGGTAWTEYSSLTGIGPTVLSLDNSPYEYIHSNADSIVRLLSGLGYDTLAIHPGYSWFYNRVNVYNYFGFDDFLYLESSFDPDTQSKGGYISEEATFDVLIEEFQSHLETNDAPLFEFCVTIQNHGGYTNKYVSDASILQEANYYTDISFTEEETDILANYFTGMIDADDQLSRLIKYLESIDEPVVLVYYGDHMPYLGSSDILETIGWGRYDGTSGEYLSMYTTPYMIWANDAAKEQTDIAQNLENTGLEDGDQFSALYLGTTLLELLDYDGSSGFYSYVNSLRDSLPVITWSLYKNGSGELLTELPGDLEGELEYYSSWSYYKMFDEVIS